MGFGAPGLLPLAALAAIPVIIHLLSRLRLRRAQFPSLMLLTSVRRERFSWVRVKEILLLILRTLALLALLLSVSRPFFRPGAATGATGSRDIVLLIDDSYSMSYSARWDSTLAVSRRLVSSLAPGRRAFLLTASGRGASTEPFPARGALSVLDTLSVSRSAAVLGPSLDRAAVLAGSLRAELHFVSDLQVRALDPDWRPPRDITPQVHRIGRDGFSNAGVVALNPEDAFPHAGRPVRIFARFRNHGRSEQTRTATLFLDGRREEKVLGLEPGTNVSHTFALSVQSAGLHACSLELGPDSLETDDRRYLCLSVPRQLKVALVGSPGSGVEFALGALRADSSALFRPVAVSPSEFGRKNLRDFEVVAVLDPTGLGTGDWNRLDFHLRSGGAALVMASANADWAKASGILATRGRARPEGFVTVRDADTSHPVLRGIGLEPLSAIRFREYEKLVPGAARVLARLSDNTPLMLQDPERRLIVWASGVNPQHSDLAYKATFVPLLHRTLSWLALGLERLSWEVGDTVRFRVEGPGPFEVSGPSGLRTIEPVVEQGATWVRFDETHLPGVYTFREPGAETPLRMVAVNPDPDEGDLAALPDSAVLTMGMELAEPGAGRVRDLSVPLLFLAALAFAAELLLLLF